MFFDKGRPVVKNVFVIEKPYAGYSSWEEFFDVKGDYIKKQFGIGTYYIIPVAKVIGLNRRGEIKSRFQQSIFSKKIE